MADTNNLVLREFRESQGLTLEQFAEPLNLDPAELDRIERGKRKFMGELLCQVLRVYKAEIDLKKPGSEYVIYVSTIKPCEDKELARKIADIKLKLTSLSGHAKEIEHALDELQKDRWYDDAKNGLFVIYSHCEEMSQIIRLDEMIDEVYQILDYVRRQRDIELYGERAVKRGEAALMDGVKLL